VIYPYRSLSILVILVCLFLATAFAEEELPSGRFEFTSTAFGLIVGFNRGEGALRLTEPDPDGGDLPLAMKTYPFSVTGFSLATVGLAKIDAVGIVYNLNDIEDFEGRYIAGEGALTIVQGGGHLIMRNQNGVVIKLQLYNKGVELRLGGSIISFTLQEPDDPQPELYSHTMSNHSLPNDLQSSKFIKP
jgi:hypothetical protein